MELTEEQRNEIVKTCLTSMNSLGYKIGTKRAESFEKAYFIGVNAMFATMDGKSAHSIALPPYWSMMLMSGRSIVKDYVDKVNGKK